MDRLVIGLLSLTLDSLPQILEEHVDLKFSVLVLRLDFSLRLLYEHVLLQGLESKPQQAQVLAAICLVLQRDEVDSLLFLSLQSSFLRFASDKYGPGSQNPLFFVEDRVIAQLLLLEIQLQHVTLELIVRLVLERPLLPDDNRVQENHELVHFEIPHLGLLLDHFLLHLFPLFDQLFLHI